VVRALSTDEEVWYAAADGPPGYSLGDEWKCIGEWLRYTDNWGGEPLRLRKLAAEDQHWSTGGDSDNLCIAHAHTYTSRHSWMGLQ